MSRPKQFEHNRFVGDTLVVGEGKIIAAGKNVTIPDGAEIIDAQGRQITPGMIPYQELQKIYHIETINAALYPSAPSGNTPCSISLTPGGEILFVANANGSDLHQISGWQPDFAGASWSPDGQWILTGSGEGRLSLIHPDGSVQRQIALAPNPGSFLVCWPKWSPDGQHIVFILSAACGGSQNLISIARADGSDLRQVTHTPDNEDFADWGTHSE